MSMRVPWVWPAHERGRRPFVRARHHQTDVFFLPGGLHDHLPAVRHFKGEVVGVQRAGADILVGKDEQRQDKTDILHDDSPFRIGWSTA